MVCITEENLQEFNRKFLEDEKNQVAMNSVVNNGVGKTAVNFQTVRENRFEFSVRLEQGEINRLV